MATVKGPLMSLDARGTIADAIVFSVWKGRNYVRRHVVPANPKSGGQLSSRAMTKFLSQQWDGLSAGEKTTWDDRAAVTNISPFNAYMKYNLKRWGGQLYPAKADPAAGDDLSGVITVLALTPGLKSISVAVTIAPLNQNWGINIYRRLTTGMGTVRQELVQTVAAEAAATFTWLDTPLTTGVDYFYRAKPFSETGVFGASAEEETAQPT